MINNRSILSGMLLLASIAGGVLLASHTGNNVSTTNQYHGGESDIAITLGNCSALPSEADLHKAHPEIARVEPAGNGCTVFLVREKKITKDSAEALARQLIASAKKDKR